MLKFRGAGQGRKALVAEVVAGELARALGFRVPELALVELDPASRAPSRTRRSRTCWRRAPGTNLGVDFLPEALPFSPAVDTVEPELAADVVWLDALVTNVDRTPQNPNLLVWHGELWLIDHGAALYFHHGGRAARPTTRAAPSRRSASTCCCPSPARSRRRTRGSRRA